MRRATPGSSTSSSSKRTTRRPRTMRSLAIFLLATSAMTGVHAATGGQFCSRNLCVNAIVENNQVTYQLVSTQGFNTLGWMAVGFGTQMPNTPIVVTWPNADGTITLSQRQAAGHVMPTLVANPPQVATLAWGNSILATNTTTIAFTHPLPATLNAVPMIWAWGAVRPSSASPNAVLQQHVDKGLFTMDLTQPMNALPTGTVVTSVVGTSTRVAAATPTASVASGSGSGSNGQQSVPDAVTNLPFTADENKMRTHGLLMSIGFLVLLPLGVFVARYSRTIPALKNRWFTAHWVIQLVFSGPLIFAGWATGYRYVSSQGGSHFQDNHTRVGLALLILYLIQLFWGTIIHFFKPRPKSLAGASTKTTSSKKKISSPHALHPTTTSASSSSTSRPKGATPSSSWPAIVARPIQNYGHAINGLVIIGLAFYNVREGYNDEWLKAFGISRNQSRFLRSLNAWWLSWVVIIPVVYVLGLALLPRQWRQETDARRKVAQAGEEKTPAVDSEPAPSSTAH